MQNKEPMNICSSINTHQRKKRIPPKITVFDRRLCTKLDYLRADILAEDGLHAQIQTCFLQLKEYRTEEWEERNLCLELIGIPFTHTYTHITHIYILHTNHRWIGK